MAYLLNQYPQPSQTFIRREIAALEALGQPIVRYSVRAWRGQLVDADDLAEKSKTKVVLDAGALGLAWAVVLTLTTRPRRFVAAVIQSFRLGRKSDRGQLTHLVYLAEACLLLRDFKRAGIDHVHAHFGTNATAVALICATLGGPSYSFTVHGPEEFDRPEALRLALKVAGASFVVAISNFGRSQLCRWSQPSDWPKLQVVRCGLDRQFLKSPTMRPPLSTRLVCVARLEEQKGILLLLQAAAQLAAEGVDFHLRIVGDGSLRQSIEKFIRDHRLERSVELTGWKSGADVRNEILAARALVLPSFAEGLPVVLMEALALETPVIATYVGGIAELVVPGLCGWMVSAGAVEPLVDALCRMPRDRRSATS